MSERPARRENAPMLGPSYGAAPRRPATTQPKALTGPATKAPGPDPGPIEPKGSGPRAPRYNLTVRLSGDERDRLEAIGRAVGKPNPLSLAATVRWLIQQFGR